MFNCEKCHLSFKTLARLLIHISEEHDLKEIFACVLCPRFFLYSNKDLKSHEETHYSDKPFSCDKCSESFRNEGILIKHQKSRIVEQLKMLCEEKPFTCNVCTVTFKVA